MASVTITTARVGSAGSVTCRRCDRKTVFPEPEWIEFLDTGLNMLIWGVREGLVTLHRCGREMEWVCEQCGIEANVEEMADRLYGSQRSRRARPVPLTTCSRCGGRLRQRERRVPGGPAD